MRARAFTAAFRFGQVGIEALISNKEDESEGMLSDSEADVTGEATHTSCGTVGYGGPLGEGASGRRFLDVCACTRLRARFRLVPVRQSHAGQSGGGCCQPLDKVTRPLDRVTRQMIGSLVHLIGSLVHLIGSLIHFIWSLVHSPRAAGAAASHSSCGRRRRRLGQGHTLVHFSAQPEPCAHPINTP